MADVPLSSPFENGRNLDIQELQSVVKVADLVGIHQVADSAPGNYNMCWLVQPTSFLNQAREPTCLNYHSAVEISNDWRPCTESL